MFNVKCFELVAVVLCFNYSGIADFTPDIELYPVELCDVSES